MKKQINRKRARKTTIKREGKRNGRQEEIRKKGEKKEAGRKRGLNMISRLRKFDKNMRSTWAAYSVKHLTLDFWLRA